jgi:hypothetical protein
VHQGGFTEFSYDVTPYIRPGKRQTLEVLVSKESANYSVNSAERRADWWLFGGIYRPVYIEVLPQEHISHVSIDARADGEIYARWRVHQMPPSPSPSTVLPYLTIRTRAAGYTPTPRPGTPSTHTSTPPPSPWATGDIA